MNRIRVSVGACLATLLLTSCSLASSPEPPKFEKAPDWFVVETVLPDQQMPYQSVEEYWQKNPIASPIPLSSYQAPSADTQRYQLTSEEKQKVAQGTYLEASSKHPAFNVSNPTYPQELLASADPDTEKAGLFFNWYIEELMYGQESGDLQEVYSVTNSSDGLRTPRMIEAMSNLYKAGGWFQGCKIDYTLSKDPIIVPDKQGKISNIFYIVNYSEKNCNLISPDGSSMQKSAVDAPMVLMATYDQEKKIYQMIGVIDATEKYFKISETGIVAVCKYSPVACPDDVYQAIRKEQYAMRVFEGVDGQYPSLN